MSLKDSDRYYEIIEKLKGTINWYEQKKIGNYKTKIFLTSGTSMRYQLQRDRVPHLLGIKTNGLQATNLFKSTNSYEILKELVFDKYTSIGSRIMNNNIDLSSIFSEYINQKIENFKRNITIDISDTIYVLEYDREKVKYMGKNPRNCDYAIFKKIDDDRILELDLVRQGELVVPVSNRIFLTESEAKHSLEDLLYDQPISIMNSIIVDNDYFFQQERKKYLKTTDKIYKMQIANNAELKYKCNLCVNQDYEYLLKKVGNGIEKSRDSYDFIEEIIDLINNGKIINRNELNKEPLSEQAHRLIDAINDNYGSQKEENKESYSHLEKQIEELKKEKEKLLKENSELNTDLEETKKNYNDANVEKQKLLVFKNNIENAFTKYNK